MDIEDQKLLWNEWKKFDNRMNELYEKEAYKFLPKLDKLVKEKLGWRRRKPEDDLERFWFFMNFVDQVYLKPSLNLDLNDSLGDSGSSSSSDDD
jgi:hypothetical protein